jgi:hypothetical protein
MLIPCHFLWSEVLGLGIGSLGKRCRDREHEQGGMGFSSKSGLHRRLMDLHFLGLAYEKAREVENALMQEQRRGKFGEDKHRRSAQAPSLS